MADVTVIGSERIGIAEVETPADTRRLTFDDAGRSLRLEQGRDVKTRYGAIQALIESLRSQGTVRRGGTACG